MMSDRPPLHSQLRDRRVDAGLGQQDVADALGRHQSVISRLESGAINLTLEWVEQLVVPLRARVCVDRTGWSVEPDEVEQ